MSNYKHGDWYCKPANEAEAKEIVERAVASGAIIADCIDENTREVNVYPWNYYYGWGVLDGETCTYGYVSGYFRHIEVEYTIEQVREKFPLPSELQATVGPHSEHEQKEVVSSDVNVCVGLPPVGSVWVRVNGGMYRVTGYANQSTTKPEQYPVTIIYQNVDNNTVWCLPASEWARSFKTERAQWVLEAKKHCSYVSNEQLRKLFNALKSGDLKAPEVNK